MLEPTVGAAFAKTAAKTIARTIAKTAAKTAAKTIARTIAKTIAKTAATADGRLIADCYLIAKNTPIVTYDATTKSTVK